MRIYTTAKLDSLKKIADMSRQCIKETVFTLLAKKSSFGGKLEHSSKSGRRLRSSYCKIDYGIFSNNHTCYLLRKGRSNRGGPSKERELYERANMRKIKKKTTLNSLN